MVFPSPAGRTARTRTRLRLPPSSRARRALRCGLVRWHRCLIIGHNCLLRHRPGGRWTHPPCRPPRPSLTSVCSLLRPRRQTRLRPRRGQPFCHPHAHVAYVRTRRPSIPAAQRRPPCEKAPAPPVRGAEEQHGGGLRLPRAAVCRALPRAR
jgi:hypothetical protein